jgi:hypothetical protein
LYLSPQAHPRLRGQLFVTRRERVFPATIC